MRDGELKLEYQIYKSSMISQPTYIYISLRGVEIGANRSDNH